MHIDDIGKRQLVGISCFMANSFHGYQYVHLRACLSCSFSFMSPTHAVVCDAAFLHALSDESVETYTSQSLQVNMTHANNTWTMPTQTHHATPTKFARTTHASHPLKFTCATCEPHPLKHTCHSHTWAISPGTSELRLSACLACYLMCHMMSHDMFSHMKLLVADSHH